MFYVVSVAPVFAQGLCNIEWFSSGRADLPAVLVFLTMAG